MSLYIAAHKAFSVPTEEGYIPLQVGAADGTALPYTPDDTGENISRKNPHFCELTGLYWIWKNTRDDYKGLVHYRRYFTWRGRRLTPADVRLLLTGADILLPRQEYLRESAWEEFCLHSGQERDLLLLQEVIEEVSPELLPAFRQVMAGNRLHLYNMLIAPRAVFDGYCHWLFTVLFRLEQRVDMTGYTPYQQRLYGFLGERLLNVWVTHAGLRVHTLRVQQTEQPVSQRLRLMARRQKNRLLFAAGR